MRQSSCASSSGRAVQYACVRNEMAAATYVPRRSPHIPGQITAGMPIKQLHHTVRYVTFSAAAAAVHSGLYETVDHLARCGRAARSAALSPACTRMAFSMHRANGSESACS